MKLEKKTHDKYGTEKLPKQWRRWAEKAGLKIMDDWGQRRGGYYMIGRGRQWRVNCYHVFEVSCPTEHFDRWANSRGGFVAVFPRTEAQFLAAVDGLVEASKHAR